jgi:hypothetical protein
MCKMVEKRRFVSCPHLLHHPLHVFCSSSPPARCSCLHGSTNTCKTRIRMSMGSTPSAGYTRRCKGAQGKTSLRRRWPSVHDHLGHRGLPIACTRHVMCPSPARTWPYILRFYVSSSFVISRMRSASLGNPASTSMCIQSEHTTATSFECVCGARSPSDYLCHPTTRPTLKPPHTYPMFKSGSGRWSGARFTYCTHAYYALP